MEIDCAAIRLPNGEVIVGTDHGSIVREHDIDLDREDIDFELGFVTERGVFLDRDEAARVAMEAGQVDRADRPLFLENIGRPEPDLRDGKIESDPK